MSDRGRGRARGRPRGSLRPSNATHERIPLDDDYEIVKSRTSSVRWSNLAVDSPRDALRGKTTWSVGESWYPDDDPEFALDENADWYDEQLEKDVGEVLDGMESNTTKETKKKRNESSLRPRVYWKKNHREEYLDELLYADGRGEFMRATGCPDCIARGIDPPQLPEIRCEDCFTPDLTCASCCVRRHTRNPFHRIEKWADSTFRKIALKDIGLKIHLNHGSMRCPLPSSADGRLLVLHTNGIHEVDLSYCGCSREIPRHLQLLRRGLYPATHQNARTCVTTALLRVLHMLALTAKVSTYDFYRTLEGLTPHASIKRPKSRYRPLLRVLTQWRHLKMLKRAGRGHHPSGAWGTADGELALACPSCPHPDVNLPVGWDEAPAEQRFLYALLVCLDANFRLKNNLVSNYSNDPGLGPGMAYMIGHGPYEEFVLSQADEEDISTCVGFQALAKATTRNTKGLRYSGVGMAVCGRSEMILPNGVGNLQKGERYANMDYIFASAIAKTSLLIVCISYDIACQWFINIFLRMIHWPRDLRPRAGLHLRPLIPKFHYWAHKEEGHEQYSFNYGDGAALSDGEAIERVWGGHNALAGSTKVSGPGTRQDVLDDNFGYWNYLKYISMGHSLIKKYKEGVAERNRQTEAHRGFTATLPEELVSEWEGVCESWSADAFPKTTPSPYEAEDPEVTEADVEKELQEREAANRPPGLPPLHKTSAASFIKMGMELEDIQRQLKLFADEQARIPRNLRESKKLNERRANLRASIEGWEQIRSVYIPGLIQLLEDQGTTVAGAWDTDPNPEDVPLWLPSSIPSERRRAACVEDLPHAELKLRTAQCASSLQSLRQVLRLKTRMVYFKNKNVRGQRDGTRSREIIDRVHKRALQFVQKYRAARSARLKLEGPGEWELTYRELKNEDVRSYAAKKKKRDADRRGIWEDGHEPPAREAGVIFDTSESESEIELASDEEGRLTEEQLRKRRKKGTGETRKELSWIWQTGQIQATSSSPDHILRAEWAKSRARTHRAREEVLLVREEMRRVLAFLQHSATTWQQRIGQREGASSALMEGLQSYANKQTALQQELATAFRDLWKTPLQDIDAEVGSAPDVGANLAHSGPAMDAAEDDGNNDNEGGEHDEDGEGIEHEEDSEGGEHEEDGEDGEDDEHDEDGEDGEDDEDGEDVGGGGDNEDHEDGMTTSSGEE